MKVLGVIPSRYGSVRLPGKPLVDLEGKSMIQRVWEQASKAKCLDDLVVATDDVRILKKVKSFGGRAVLTSRRHPSGTDRIAEAVKGSRYETIVNIQGDEPLLPPSLIEQAVAALAYDSNAVMGTLRKRFADSKEAQSPQVVKVVVDKNNNALYFSRSLIPYPRTGSPVFYKHIGIYAYRREFLNTYSKLRPTPLEKFEGLEQLRVLEHGFKIKAFETRLDSISVDTSEDAEKVKELIRKSSKKE